MNPYPTEEKIKEIEWAYAEIQKRGWGFSSTGQGFGDPSSLMTAVGPYDGVILDVWGVDSDPVEAVKKAIAKEKSIVGCSNPKSKGS